MVLVASGNISPKNRNKYGFNSPADRFRQMYGGQTCGQAAMTDFTPFSVLRNWMDEYYTHSQEYIDDFDDDIPSDSRLWVPSLDITEQDRKELLSGQMLSDKHIYAIEQLLSQRRPDMGGLQDPVLSQVHFEPVHTESLQIHHTRGNHWVMSHWQPGHVVNVYDTLYDNVSDDLLSQLEDIYVDAPHSDNGELIYDMPEVQRQYGSEDCGLFTAAVAVHLCEGDVDPTRLYFSQGKMRRHLYKCFENECLEPFPVMYL